MKRTETASELIVQQAMEESPGELSSQHPMVLSCGGIYIPYDKRRMSERPFLKVLNLPDDEHSSKIVVADTLKNPLALLLQKEYMN